MCYAKQIKLILVQAPINCKPGKYKWGDESMPLIKQVLSDEITTILSSRIFIGGIGTGG